MSEATGFKKLIGYGTVALFLASMIVLMAGGGFFLWQGSCDCRDQSWPVRLVMLFIALLLLLLPGFIAYKLVRRRLKTGSFKPSPEEIAAARSKCATAQPLWKRILVAAIWSFTAATWTYTATQGRHPGGMKWVSAGMSWVVAGMWIWRIFRPQSCAMPEQAATMLNLNH